VQLPSLSYHLECIDGGDEVFQNDIPDIKLSQVILAAVLP